MKDVDLCRKYLKKAEKTFGYSPQKSTEEGLVNTLEWCASTGLL